MGCCGKSKNKLKTNQQSVIQTQSSSLDSNLHIMSEKQGFDHELDFWSKFVKTERFKNNWISDTPNPELRPESYDLIISEIQGKKTAKVLDIGSGVVSILRGTVSDKNLTTCDPLADKYATIFKYDEHGLKQPIQAYGEALPFKDNSFNVVHICNALDHTQAPEEVISEMERVCKKGGLILISGFTNEGEHEKYRGLHQWNIKLDVHGHIAALTILQKQTLYIFHNPNEVVFAEMMVIPETGREYFIFAYRNE